MILTTPYQARDFEAPPVTPETAPYWEAAARGQLLLKYCEACGAVHHYPRSLCPRCGSDRTSWKTSSGRGEVYAVSVTRRGTPVPYAMAYVRLEDGVTLMSNIVDCDLDAIRIGDLVEAVFVAAPGGRQPVPMFRPLASGDRRHD